MRTFKNANGWRRSSDSIVINYGKPNPKTNEVRSMAFNVGFGYLDDVHLFTENKHIIIMSEQPRLGYVGVSVFTKKGDPVWDSFCQNEQDLPAGIFDLVPINRAKYLLNVYWYD